MRQLLCLFILVSLLNTGLTQTAASTFTLRGQFRQPSTDTFFTIFYFPMMMDSFPIRKDGSFVYSAKLAEPGEVQIGNPSTSVKVWVDTGLTTVYLSEKPGPQGAIKLLVDSVSGSDDSRLYHYMLLPKSSEIGRTTVNRSFSSPQEMKNYFDSLDKVRKPRRDSLFSLASFREIDSLFKVRPDSKMLPWLIRFYGNALGTDRMQELYDRLSYEQRRTRSGKDLQNELNKRHMLRPGNFFNDFTMLNDHGKKFHLSSLQDKYILIDFWASWCAPCRANHPELRKLYADYKSRRFEIVSISLDEDSEKWLDAIRHDGLDWINLSELKGWDDRMALKYRITSIPYSILLDQNRKILLLNPTIPQLRSFFAEQ